MTTFLTNKVLTYPSDQLFTVVADVKEYPEFLPGISEIVLLEQLENTLVVKVWFGNSIFQENYTCKVSLSPFNHIKIVGLEGPFTYLESTWDFINLNSNETLVKFSLNFQFKSTILKVLGAPIFEKLAENMVRSFEERAKTLYCSP